MPDGPPKNLRLPRTSRLASSREFALIRQNGRRLALGCLIANWRIMPDGSNSRLGVVTAKSIGNSVKRSRARRLLRESFRLHQHDLAAPVDLVLVARPSIVQKDFAGVEKDYLCVLSRSKLLKA